jgi:F-type H+-transporting ATPase subunit b
VFVVAMCALRSSAVAWAQPHEPKAEEHPAEGADAHAGDAHAAHDHIGLANPGSGITKPQEVKSDLAFATFLVFLVLLAILWKFAWGPIVKALEAREQRIEHNIKDAERANEEAKSLLKQYEQKLATAANEVRELLDEARRDAEHTKQAILAEGKTLADAERARALREIDAATDQALEALSKHSAELAVELASKILQAKLSGAEHAKLIEEAMARFPAMTASSN